MLSLIPPGAGVGSAIGFLRAPVAFEAVRSAYLRLSRFDAGHVNAVIRELAEEAGRFVHAAAPGAALSQECTAYIRYVGQGWEIPVAIEIRDYAEADGAVLRGAFEAVYRDFFGRTIDGLDAEIISWSLKASAPVPAVSKLRIADATSAAPIVANRPIFDAARGAYIDAAIVERGAMATGARVAGPAAIIERETTTIVSRGHEAIMQPDGCILIRGSAA